MVAGKGCWTASDGAGGRRWLDLGGGRGGSCFGRRLPLDLDLSGEDGAVGRCCAQRRRWSVAPLDGWKELERNAVVRKPIAGSHGYRLEEDDGAPNSVLRRCAELSTTSSKTACCCCTPTYIAPEVIEKKDYDNAKVDL
ncbi:hypothetical protein ACLOJK_034166 [Asimina triloba]